MLKKLKNIKPIKVILILLIVNIGLFSMSSIYFSKVKYPISHSGEKLNDNEFIESGWKLLNWSIGMYRFFKGNKPNS